MKTIKLLILSLVAMLFATNGCIEDYTIHGNEIAAIKGKIKPNLPVSYVITGDMAGAGPADNITLTLGAAFGTRAGTFTGRVTMAWFSFGREKGMRLNFIVANDLYAFVVMHYQKKPKAAFGIFKPGDPWHMETKSGHSEDYPEKGKLIDGITVTVTTVIQQ
jgi:hypothetical protein